MIFVFAVIFQLLIQFIHSFAVLCTVARALRGCVPGACFASPLASQNIQRFDVDKTICCTGSVCIMLLVGFQISSLQWINDCLIVVVVPYNSKLICSSAACFQHFG